MGETEDRRCVITKVIILGLLFGEVFGDQSCDDALKTTSFGNEDKLPSTDLVVCSEQIQIKCGEDYSPSLLEKRPTVLFPGKLECKYVTIIYFGKLPDFNSTNLMWLEFDVPVEDLKNGYHGQSGNERVIYKKPKISGGTSDYFFFVYCQKDVIQNFNCCTQEEKENLDVKALAKKNNLGDPVAVLYFQVTADGQVMDQTPQKEGVCQMQMIQG